MRSKRKIEIPVSKIKQIFNDDYKFFKKIEKNVFCANCVDDHVTTIVDYKVFILSNYDLLLKGKCQRCNHDVARVLETGDVEKYIIEMKKIYKP